MQKGYVDFETFKQQQNYTKRTPKCPRCKKPMETVMVNAYGSKMCPACFILEQSKRKKPKEVSIEEDKYAEYDIDILK